jgi:hypothetical protein
VSLIGEGALQTINAGVQPGKSLDIGLNPNLRRFDPMFSKMLRIRRIGKKVELEKKT